MSGRGGKRPGAGRKPSLTWEEQLIVAGECEKRWHSLIEDKRKAMLDALMRKADYRELVRRAREVPVAERPSWRTTYEGEDHADDVVGAIRAMRGMPADSEEEPSRVFHLAPSRPYRARAAIKETVAKWASEKFGKSVSLRTVESCWTMVCSIHADEADD